MPRMSGRMPRKGRRLADRNVAGAGDVRPLARRWPLLAGELSVFARFGELDVRSTRVDGRSFGVTLTYHLDF